MKRFLVLTLLLFLPLVFSDCKGKDENCTENDYNDCITTRPDSGYAEVSITHNFQNKNVEVRLYQGNFEDGRLVWEKSYSKTNTTELLDVENYYSFTATYVVGEDTIVAVDGGRVKVISYNMCELTCYEARTLNIDLTID